MRRFVIIFIWIIMIAGLFSLLGFAYKAHQSIICNNVDILINYNSNDIFVTTNDINDFFVHKNIKIKGATLSEINTGYIESVLYQIPYIETADVYTTIDGNVKMTIMQRKPIIKVFNKYNQSFYIDDKGRLMPSNDNYTAHLPIANGNISNLYNPSLKLDVNDTASADTIIMQTPLYKIFRLAQYINRNDFWKAMVEEIFINNEGDIELFTTIGDQTVIFGGIDNMEEKFDNLLIFYKEELNKFGWNKYKSINLKYKNQVICSKI